MTEDETRALLKVEDFPLPVSAPLPDAQTYPPYEVGVIYTRWPYLNLAFLGFRTTTETINSGGDLWYQWWKR